MNQQESNYYGRRFELLLDRFRRPDGYRWSNAELAQASGGTLSPQYLGQLAKGKYRRPGTDRLSAIAEVVGFPVELWFLPTSGWSSALREQTDAPGAADPLLSTLSDAQARQLLRQWRTLSAGHRAAVLALVGTLSNIESGSAPEDP